MSPYAKNQQPFIISLSAKFFYDFWSLKDIIDRMLVVQYDTNSNTINELSVHQTWKSAILR